MIRVLVTAILIYATLGCSDSHNQSTPTYSDSKSSLTPENSDAIPDLTGTAWLLVATYPKGTTPTYLAKYFTYLFCEDGRFDIDYGTYRFTGTYQVKGNKLIEVLDGPQALRLVFTIKWNGNEHYLELVDNDTVHRLHYDKKKTCLE